MNQSGSMSLYLGETLKLFTELGTMNTIKYLLSCPML